jgi:hypothetical protein
MTRHHILGALGAGLILAGCASEAHRHSSATAVPPAAAPTAVAPAAVAPPTSTGGSNDPYVRALYADARLDPIRHKVPLLLGPDVVQPAYLSNDTKPSVAEKKAITAWLQVREEAQRYRTAHAGEPSPLLTRTRKEVTEAILQLQKGELTYGAFARRIQEIDRDYQAAMRQNVGLRN